jgi:hypothetical protein
MFGYATDESPEMLPWTLLLAHRLAKALADARRNGTMPWLRPDAKTQVMMTYATDENGGYIPLRVDSIVVSTQHSDAIATADIQTQVMENIVRKVVPARFLDEQTRYHINPSGQFVIGGPQSDAGLTGRKIIVDTYGGRGAHGGGAFSGKVPASPFSFLLILLKFILRIRPKSIVQVRMQHAGSRNLWWQPVLQNVLLFNLLMQLVLRNRLVFMLMRRRQVG